MSDEVLDLSQLPVHVDWAVLKSFDFISVPDCTLTLKTLVTCLCTWFKDLNINIWCTIITTYLCILLLNCFMAIIFDNKSESLLWSDTQVTNLICFPVLSLPPPHTWVIWPEIWLTLHVVIITLQRCKSMYTFQVLLSFWSPDVFMKI